MAEELTFHLADFEGPLELLLAALALIFNLLVCNVIYHRSGGFHTNLILLLILPVIPGAVDDSAD